VTAVASTTCVRVVVDHTMPTPLQRSTKLKILHCLYTLSRLHLSLKPCWASIILHNIFFTHIHLIHLMRCLLSLVNLIAVTNFYWHLLYITANKEYLRRIQIIFMLLIQHFMRYFVWNFYSNWLLFLRVLQENKSGFFSEHSVQCKNAICRP